MLNDLSAEPPALLESLQPEDRIQPKNAAKAFLISLIAPGFGQVYAGRKTAGLVTLGFFLAMLPLTIILGIRNPFWGIALTVAIALYVFAFLDAYFSVLEYNAGFSPYVVGTNPRIACVLNLLTKSFGYFYLGYPAIAIVLFVVLGGVFVKSRAIWPGNSWVVIFWVAVQIVLALDAYRKARKRLIHNCPAYANHSWRSNTTGQLSPVLPVALAGLLIVPVILLMAFGAFSLRASSVSSKAGHFTSTPQGGKYENKNAGMSLLLPEGWVVTSDDKEMKAQNAERSCSIIILRQGSLLSPEKFQHQVEASLDRKPGFSVYGHSSSTLAGRPAAVMTVAAGANVTEEVYTTRKGLSLISLFLVSRDETCAPQLATIRDNFRLN